MTHMNRLIMESQHRAKSLLKPLVFADVDKPRRIKAGPGRGVVAILNRRRDVQRELGMYETELTRSYRKYVRPGTLVFDVGAADGLTALTYARLGASVIAFEPDPKVVGRFRRNLDLNPLLAARITLVTDQYESNTAGDYAAPDFVKIDVDGGEADVVRALPGRPPCVVVETHSHSLESDCTALLESRGYRVRVIPNARWRTIEHNRWLLALVIA